MLGDLDTRTHALLLNLTTNGNYEAHDYTMHLTRKLDRAVQWAGERMGAEAKATQTDEFTSLQAEMELRHEG